MNNKVIQSEVTMNYNWSERKRNINITWNDSEYIPLVDRHNSIFKLVMLSYYTCLHEVSTWALWGVDNHLSSIVKPHADELTSWGETLHDAYMIPRPGPWEWWKLLTKWSHKLMGQHCGEVSIGIWMFSHIFRQVLHLLFHTKKLCWSVWVCILAKWQPSIILFPSKMRNS